MILSKQLIIGILLPTFVACSVIIGSAYSLLSSENNNLRQENSFLSHSIKNKTQPIPQESVIDLDEVGDSDVHLVQLFLEKPWIKETSTNGRVTISYPEGFWTQEAGEVERVVDKVFYPLESKEHYDALRSKAIVEGGFENEGDFRRNAELGYMPTWNDMEAEFTKALQGKSVLTTYGETQTLSEKLVVLNGKKFIAAVTLSPNGECSLRYTTFQKQNRLTIVVNICDDTTMPTPGPGAWNASPELKTWALGVIDGTQGSFRTALRRLAAFKLIATMEVK